MQRWLERYPLSYPVFTLLAAPPGLFLKTPEYLFVRELCVYPPECLQQVFCGDLANNLATPRLSRDRQNGFPS
jgi:hypothetical protein